jgi:hypothetical protein
MGGYDPGLDNLQTLCAALEATNHVLEAGTADLDTTGKRLAQEEDDLREALAGLKTEADAFEKEVETAEAQATEAVNELDTAAHQALETWMPAFEEKVGDARQESHQELTQRATTLESEFEELQSRGFDPLDAVLTNEDAEFERWTNEAETALKAQVDALDAAGTEAAQDIQRAFSALTTADLATASASGAMDNTLRDQLDGFDKDEPQEVERRCGEIRTDVAEAIQEFGRGVEAMAAAAHQAAEGYAKEAADAIEAENRQAMDAVEQAGTALADANTEFEQTGADAGSSEPEITAIVALRPKVETADDEVTEIKRLMEAVQ